MASSLILERGEHNLFYCSEVFGKDENTYNIAYMHIHKDIHTKCLQLNKNTINIVEYSNSEIVVCSTSEQYVCIISSDIQV